MSILSFKRKRVGFENYHATLFKAKYSLIFRNLFGTFARECLTKNAKILLDQADIKYGFVEYSKYKARNLMRIAADNEDNDCMLAAINIWFGNQKKSAANDEKLFLNFEDFRKKQRGTKNVSNFIHNLFSLTNNIIL